MAEPLTLYSTSIKKEWIDEYDHMNVANYVLVCDQATYAFWEYVNGGRPIEERGGAEYIVLETHVNYLNEVRLGDPVRVTTQLLECDDKRFRIFHTLHHAGENFISATNEVKGLGFDLNARRAMAFRPDVRERMAKLLEDHGRLPFPEAAGKGIVLSRR
jgi:acyl-CoA thioester hydrolase